MWTECIQTSRSQYISSCHAPDFRVLSDTLPWILECTDDRIATSIHVGIGSYYIDLIIIDFLLILNNLSVSYSIILCQVRFNVCICHTDIAIYRKGSFIDVILVLPPSHNVILGHVLPYNIYYRPRDRYRTRASPVYPYSVRCQVTFSDYMPSRHIFSLHVIGLYIFTPTAGEYRPNLHYLCGIYILRVFCLLQWCWNGGGGRWGGMSGWEVP